MGNDCKECWKRGAKVQPEGQIIVGEGQIPRKQLEKYVPDHHQGPRVNPQSMQKTQDLQNIQLTQEVQPIYLNGKHLFQKQFGKPTQFGQRPQIQNRQTRQHLNILHSQSQLNDRRAPPNANEHHSVSQIYPNQNGTGLTQIIKIVPTVVQFNPIHIQPQYECSRKRQGYHQTPANNSFQMRNTQNIDQRPPLPNLQDVESLKSRVSERNPQTFDPRPQPQAFQPIAQPQHIPQIKFQLRNASQVAQQTKSQLQQQVAVQQHTHQQSSLLTHQPSQVLSQPSVPSQNHSQHTSQPTSSKIRESKLIQIDVLKQGLPNKSLICFLNSSLQMLYSAQELKQLLKKDKSELPYSDIIGRLFIVMDKLNVQSSKSLILDQLIAQLQKTNEDYQNNTQQDALDFFLLLLSNLIHEQKDKVEKKFQMTYQTQCECKHNNISIFREYSLTLGMRCVNCKKDMTTAMLERPTYVLLLKNRQETGIQQHISIPFKGENQGRQATCELELISFVIYQGNGASGHYLSRRRAIDGQWYNFNDNYVRKLSSATQGLDRRDKVLFCMYQCKKEQ